MEPIQLDMHSFQLNVNTMAENLAKFVIDFPYFLYLYFSSVIQTLIKIASRTRKDFDSSDVILVTGAASGIGQNSVLKLAKTFPESTYVLWDISQNGLKETARKCKEFGALSVYTFQVDLSNKQDVLNTAALVRDQVGNVTVLWNNAGTFNGQTFLDGDSEKDDNVILVNFLSQMWTIREFLPDMVKSGKGHLISTCSGLAFYRYSHLSSYIASKYGIRGFMETLRFEMREHPKKPDIKISVIYTGFVKSPLLSGMSFEPRYQLKNFLPLEVDDVGDQILDGILKEKEEILIPGWIPLLEWCYRNTPYQFLDMLEKYLFGNVVLSKSL